MYHLLNDYDIIRMIIINSEQRDIVHKSIQPSPAQQPMIFFLPAHSASFTYNLVSRMQILNFGGPQDTMFLQICNEKRVFWTQTL